MLKGLWTKFLAFGGLLLAGLAAFWKWRADVNAAKAEKQKRRADTASATAKRYADVDAQRAKVDGAQAKRRAKAELAHKAGIRRGLGKWLVLVILLAGCTTTDLVPPVVLQCPPRPALPTLSAEDLACLSNDAYDALIERDLRLREYAEDLEVYCQHPTNE